MPTRTIAMLLVCVCFLPFVAACASGSATSTSRAAGSATDDATITARVKTVLLNDTQINATKINVSTSNGVVTMSGQVRSKAEEDRAVQLARGVSGVRDVKSALQVGG